MVRINGLVSQQRLSNLTFAPLVRTFLSKMLSMHEPPSSRVGHIHKAFKGEDDSSIHV